MQQYSRVDAILALSLSERVQRGVDLLDSFLPEWRAAISPTDLDMADTERDVLGHLFGDFLTGMTVLGLSDNYRAAEHGFTLMADHEPKPRWKKLAGLWRAQLEQAGTSEVPASATSVASDDVPIVDPVALVGTDEYGYTRTAADQEYLRLFDAVVLVDRDLAMALDAVVGQRLMEEGVRRATQAAEQAGAAVVVTDFETGDKVVMPPLTAV